MLDISIPIALGTEYLCYVGPMCWFMCDSVMFGQLFMFICCVCELVIVTYITRSC